MFVATINLKIRQRLRDLVLDLRIGELVHSQQLIRIRAGEQCPREIIHAGHEDPERIEFALKCVRWVFRIFAKTHKTSDSLGLSGILCLLSRLLPIDLESIAEHDSELCFG